MKTVNKVIDNITSIFSLAGITFSIQDIANYLNIILLIISIINLVLVLFFKIKSIIQDKSLSDKDKAEKIDTEFKKVEKDLEDKIDETKRGDE